VAGQGLKNSHQHSAVGKKAFSEQNAEGFLYGSGAKPQSRRCSLKEID